MGEPGENTSDDPFHFDFGIVQNQADTTQAAYINRDSIDEFALSDGATVQLVVFEKKQPNKNEIEGLRRAGAGQAKLLIVKSVVSVVLPQKVKTHCCLNLKASLTS